MIAAPVIERSTESFGDERLHVVHVVLSLECGGLEQVVLDLVHGGRKAGQQVSVICLERKGVLAEEVESAGARVLCCEKPAGLHVRLMRRVLREQLLELRPDVVHSHQIGALFHVGPVAKKLGIRAIVHTEHGKHFEHRAKTRWLGRYASLFADKYFCVSRDIASGVLRHRITWQRKVKVVPNGIDTLRFSSGRSDAAAVRAELGIPAEVSVIGTVGRLAEIKQQDLLIHAFAKVKRRFPNAFLLLVGDGPERRRLEQLAHQLNIADAVCFAGYREDRERLLSVMSVFALTSRSEGMPLSILEAWAAGIPVLAANVGGLPDLIDDGRTGYLVDSRDPGNWAQMIGTLLDDRESAGQMAAGAKAHVEESFSRLTMIRAYADQYRALLRETACR